jgi:sortase (surface protein transpeptidase)
VPDSIKNNEGDSLRTLWDKAQKKAIDNQINQSAVVAESPTRIVISKIGVDATISNPSTTNVTTLDEYLKLGAVRYPGSGLLGVGNMFIFGHSTGAKIYRYMVSSVVLVDQTRALVEFNDKNMLTLSTCNTFGAKSERYVVEANYLP